MCAGAPAAAGPDAAAAPPCAGRVPRGRAPGPHLLALLTDGGSCTIIDA
ncbi:hypothetical protein ATKI12_7712 [Kitasatospora sp. Ki12]